MSHRSYAIRRPRRPCAFLLNKMQAIHQVLSGIASIHQPLLSTTCYQKNNARIIFFFIKKRKHHSGWCVMNPHNDVTHLISLSSCLRTKSSNSYNYFDYEILNHRVNFHAKSFMMSK